MEIGLTIESPPVFQRLVNALRYCSQCAAFQVTLESVHVNCYITKPVSLDGFMQVVQKIDDFWLTVVKLPGEQAA